MNLVDAELPLTLRVRVEQPALYTYALLPTWGAMNKWRLFYTLTEVVDLLRSQSLMSWRVVSTDPAWKKLRSELYRHLVPAETEFTIFHINTVYDFPKTSKQSSKITYELILVRWPKSATELLTALLIGDSRG